MSKKKINPIKLTNEEIDQLSIELGSKVREICDNAAERANKILSKYGMLAKIAISIEPAQVLEKKVNLKKEA